MEGTVTIAKSTFFVDYSKPLDISIPLTGTEQNPNAWYLDHPTIKPVVFDNWEGSVASGKSSTNFNSIWFNPHAHGTHTECLGHITAPFYSINDSLNQFVFLAQVISIEPRKIGEDYVIALEDILKISLDKNISALVIRTLPNGEEKTTKQYSHTNPPFLDAKAAAYFVEQNIDHLLIDLPSVDKEKDNGELLFHKAFWNLKDTLKPNKDARFKATITEFIFVPNTILDGLYLLHLQITSLVNDASPSKPILYKLKA